MKHVAGIKIHVPKIIKQYPRAEKGQKSELKELPPSSRESGVNPFNGTINPLQCAGEKCSQSQQTPSQDQKTEL